LSFAGCALETLEIDGQSTFFRVVGEFVMDFTGQKIICSIKSASVVVIPDDVGVLGRDCFSQTPIRECRFGPNSKLRAIESAAFAQCSELALMNIPSQVAIIGDQCFRLCKSLTAISFCSNTNLTHIKAAAFDRSGLLSIAIPSSVEVLGSRCFNGCSQLVSVTFPGDSKLVWIQEELFCGCSSLGPICLPSSVERVSNHAFSGCTAMTQLAFATPSRIRDLLDLPPNLVGCVDIPDSVEILTVPTKQAPTTALRFGPDSKLTTIRTDARRAFLQVASRTVKIARSKYEFDESSLYRRRIPRYDALLWGGVRCY
jgi:hypothetical protein